MRTRITEKTHVYGKIESSRIACKGKAGKSVTRQEFKDSSDINNIVRKYNVTGILSSGDVVNQRKPEYGDYEGIDYQATCNKIARVEQDFMKLDPEVRALSNNDAGEWLNNLQKEESAKIIADNEKAIREKAQADENERKRVAGTIAEGETPPEPV